MRSKKFLVVIGVFIVIVFLSIILFSTSTTKESKLAPDSGLTSATVTPLPETSVQLQLAIDEAKNSANEYDTWQANLKNDYPWLRRLPLAGEKYYVYFDLNREKFIGFLYTSTGDNIAELKAEIIRQLKDDKQIPVENYSFEWTVSTP